MSTVETFKPRSSAWGFGTGLVVALAMTVGLLAHPSARTVLELAWPALAAFGGWLFFWAPSLTVDDAGVRVRNVLRTVDIPWPAIVRVDTKYALTLHTRNQEYQVWAAPVTGRHAATRLGPGDLRGLPESSFGAGGIRPGDALSGASGQAAYLVRRRWDVLRDAGFLDAGSETGHENGAVRWNTPEVAVALVLLTCAAITLF